MKVTKQPGWIISCTENFGETVAFFRDVIGLDFKESGVPATDTQFTDFAQFEMPNGIVLEVVKPNASVRQLYKAPILSISVDDVGQARREMESKQIEFVAPTFNDTHGWGWTYFRALDGNIYQIQGPYKE